MLFKIALVAASAVAMTNGVPCNNESLVDCTSCLGNTEPTCMWQKTEKKCADDVPAPVEGDNNIHNDADHSDAGQCLDNQTTVCKLQDGKCGDCVADGEHCKYQADGTCVPNVGAPLPTDLVDQAGCDALHVTKCESYQTSCSDCAGAPEDCQWHAADGAGTCIVESGDANDGDIHEASGCDNSPSPTTVAPPASTGVTGNVTSASGAASNLSTGVASFAAIAAAVFATRN